MKLLLSLMLLLAGGCSVAQTNLYVDSSVATSGTGSSWPSAYKTLNEALNVVNSGNTAAAYTVSIAKGTYFPGGIRASARQDSTFLLVRGKVTLAGGFPAGGGTRNVSTNQTILSSASNPGRNHHAMVLARPGAATDTVVLDGLYFDGGNGTGSGSFSYNGVSVSRAAGNLALARFNGLVQLRACSFINNLGGAIVSQATAIDLAGCTFTGNRGPNGGAIFCDTANVSVRNCTFSRNIAPAPAGYGGALYLRCATAGSRRASISNCSFASDTSSKGGAIWCSYMTLKIDSSSFADNVATGGYFPAEGGAVLSEGGYDTITNCSFSHNKSANTGGSFSENGNTLRLFNCSFSNDSTYGPFGSSGGSVAISNGHSAVNISKCIFQNSYAVSTAGAMDMITSNSCKIEDCVFAGNASGSYGGAMRIANQGAVSRCRFAGNSSRSGGAILTNAYTAGYTISMDNCLFSGNFASSFGGALYNEYSSPLITNCSFSGDTAFIGMTMANFGFVSSPSAPVVRNSIIWDGDSAIYNATYANATVTSSIVKPGSGVYTGTGNLNAYPRFVAPLPGSAAPTSSGNYRLQPCSPAINAGTNLGSYVGVLDLADSARLFGTIVDMGAYEFQGAYSSPPAVPPITGGSTACRKTLLQLSNAVSGGTWSSSNVAVASVDTSGRVTPLAAGTTVISYRVTASGGCDSTVRHSIAVNAVDTGVVQIGAQFSANEASGVYQWIDCGNNKQPIAGQTAQTFTATANGSYAVIVSRNGCGDTSACYVVSGLGTATAANTAALPNVYPTLSSGYLLIDWQGSPRACTAALFELSGKKVLQVTRGNERHQRIELGQLADGVYLLRAEVSDDNGGGRKIFRIVLNRQ